MSVLTVPLCIFSCLAQAGPSKESIQKYAHLGLNNNNNNNNKNRHIQQCHTVIYKDYRNTTGYQ